MPMWMSKNCYITIAFILHSLYSHLVNYEVHEAVLATLTGPE